MEIFFGKKLTDVLSTNYSMDLMYYQQNSFNLIANNNLNFGLNNVFFFYKETQ